MAASLLRPSLSSSAVATYRFGTAASRSIDLSAPFFPSRPLLANRLDLDPLENRLDELRRDLVLADDVCASETDLARVLLAAPVPSSPCCAAVVVFVGVTPATSLALQLLWPRGHCLAMP